MGHLLKAMEFWVWGLIAIGLSIMLVSVDYRAALWHLRDSPEPNPALAKPSAAAGSSTRQALDSGNAIARRAEIERQFAQSMDPGTVADAAAESPGGYLTMAKIYYQQNDCSRAVLWSDRALAAFGKASEPPSESAYQIKLQCASDTRNNVAAISDLSDLVRLTNKTQYWNSLIRLLRADLRDDRDTLLLYRIMYAVGAMSVDSDYIEMAQLLADAGQPRAAQVVLEKAMRSGIVKEEKLARTRQLMEENAARASETGLAYDAATHDAFERIKDDPKIDARVIELWRLYAETHW